MAKLVRFTPEVVEFILQKMSEGYDIAQIAKTWPDKVPNKDSIYRKSLDDPEFAEKVDQAYTILLMHRLDELHEISSKTAVELYPDVEDWRQAEATLKRRMDAAKFVLGKMAPVLSKRFDKTSKVEISGELAGGPQIAVINYYQEPVALQPATKVIDHDKQD
jgi:hypothetical protein